MCERPLRRLPARAITCFFRKRWLSQDVVIVVKGALPEQPFLYDQGPQGHLDWCRWSGPRTLDLRGWAAEASPGHAIREVRVSINGGFRNAGITGDRIDVPEGLRNPKNETH